MKDNAYILVAELIKLKRCLIKIFNTDFEFPHIIIIALKIIEKSSENNDLGIKISKLGKLLLISKPAATQLCNTMYKKELIKRTPDTADRRNVFISLTKKGKEVLNYADEMLLKSANKMVDKLGDQKFLQLVNSLQECNKLLDDILDENIIERN